MTPATVNHPKPDRDALTKDIEAPPPAHTSAPHVSHACRKVWPVKP